MRNFVVLDTETTGLQPGLDELLQVAIIDQDGCVLFNQKFRPQFTKSWPEAEAIHHISSADVKNEKSYRSYKKEVQKIVCAAPLIVGYNVVFDLSFLDIELPIQHEIYDIMEAFAPIYAQKRSGWYAWQTLKVCASYYGYKYRAHDALEDARATLYCYRAIKQGRS